MCSLSEDVFEVSSRERARRVVFCLGEPYICYFRFWRVLALVFTRGRLENDSCGDLSRVKIASLSGLRDNDLAFVCCDDACFL